MGLGDPTGINLPYETRHMIAPTREWKRNRLNEPWFPGDTTNLAIGQGFLRVTPLQIAVFTASIARNEVVSQPTILKLSPQEIANRPPPKPLGLSPADHAAIIEGMEQAALVGTAKLASIPGVGIAGKTGTAQVDKDGGKIELAWVVIYAPVHDPKIAISVMLEGQELNRSWGGGAHAAPIAKKVLTEYFRKHPELMPPPPSVAPVTASAGRP